MDNKNIQILYYTEVLDEVIKGEFETEDEAHKAIKIINTGVIPEGCSIAEYDGISYLNSIKQQLPS
jgi:hypothetical protein